MTMRETIADLRHQYESKRTMKTLVVVLFLTVLMCYSASSESIRQPQHMQTKVGEPVTLTCYSKPGTSVVWSFLGSISEELEIVVEGNVVNTWQYRVNFKSNWQGNYFLTILRPLVNDSGTYACINESGSGYRHQIHLTVHDVYYSVMVGKPILLPCFTTLDEPVDWTFIKFHSKDDTMCIVHRGSAINENVTVESQGDGEYSLVIRNPQPEDTGLYTCIENAGLGKPHQRHSVFLNISGNQPISAVSALAAATVIFSCDVKNYSLIRWSFRSFGSQPHETISLYNGNNLDDNLEIGKYQVRFAADRLLHNLQVNEVNQNDVGHYICSPVTSEPTTTQFFDLKQLIQDVDECQTGEARCDQNARCINMIGSFTCECFSGFSGDGFSCTDERQAGITNRLESSDAHAYAHAFLTIVALISVNLAINIVLIVLAIIVIMNRCRGRRNRSN